MTDFLALEKKLIKRFSKKVTPQGLKKFQEHVYYFYKENYRSFPWRETYDPYATLVSEIMLQQTQTDRVLPKYLAFLESFSDFHALAKAPLREVLALWQGLGYNRRAKALHNCAKRLVNEFEGVLPNNREMLMTLPGIGPYTSGAVCTFAFGEPLTFIETNIRSVYLHFFFNGKKDIADEELLAYLEKTVDKKDPRSWYYALMDYGVFVKKSHGNPNKKSKHYTKQSKFEGSNRQIRGKILKVLLAHTKLSKKDIKKIIKKDREKIDMNLVQMEQEGLLECTDEFCSVKN